MNNTDITNVRRIYVEKNKGLDVEATGLLKDLQINLDIKGLTSVRILNRYDVQNITTEEFEKAKRIIFAEPNTDRIYDEDVAIKDEDKYFLWEYLPGQYDQRADSAAQCVQLLTKKDRPLIRAAKLIILSGSISGEEFSKIKAYCINPVEARETDLSKPQTLEMELTIPTVVATLDGFIDMSDEQIEKMTVEMGFAMSAEDLKFCRDYFKNEEKRNPTITEIKVIDTYWSDHCRHTTFQTIIDDVKIDNGVGMSVLKEAFEDYKDTKVFLGRSNKDLTLMDIATAAMRKLKKTNKLQNLDESEEINACSIVVTADINGKNEDWLVMFKNETHNHPTEIEPFGGAATCLGGAIRDPLSGRSYVYQAMRVTGSGDPTVPVSETMSGKLPQRKITTGAAAGYSSYGNQIGLATGQVSEVYDPGFIAKRMEIGAVVAAAPKSNVVREAPESGDIVILLGGRTGRDGCGGATGSSKEHTEESLTSCGSEVQKGNPPTERKIQRLFRNSDVSRMIKRCNDFGAGGVCVAIGELSDSLDINLNLVPKKYEGLDGTELAISESQERMAVVISKNNRDNFINYALAENLEAVYVADITDTGRLRMYWNDKTIVDISRDFLNTNGVKQRASVHVEAPDPSVSFFNKVSDDLMTNDVKTGWLTNLSKLNVCSQKGLAERFDSTIGAGTVLMPFGGKYQLTPAEGMAAKLPILNGDTSTGTLMSYGDNPVLSTWSPFHGAIYAVLQSVSRIVAMGGNYKDIRLTFQEYFEKLGKNPEKWGKPFSALLGGYFSQIKLGIAAIGGKDSMSGTFKDLTVPPTLVSFALCPVNVNNVISNEFKKSSSKVALFRVRRDTDNIPDFEQIDKHYNKIHSMINGGLVLSAAAIGAGGVAETISKMSFGNKIGFSFFDNISVPSLYKPNYGSLVLELDDKCDVDKELSGYDFYMLGETIDEPVIKIDNEVISIDEMLNVWTSTLEKVFPTKATADYQSECIKTPLYNSGRKNKSPQVNIAKPRVFIPVFPGTNCEYDTAKAFERAGAKVNTLVIRNLTSSDIDYTIEEMCRYIDNSQIIMLPGGFSGGDEPDGSGKFIATTFRNPNVKESVSKLLQCRDGLMLGICNGFQALIKLGLVPYGEIRELDESCPTLTFNTLGRHVSCVVNTRITSNLSPWFSNVKIGDMHSVAVSHGEGRFIATDEMLRQLSDNGQIATQYVDFNGNPTYDISFNPNGSMWAIEGITSPDGRILGKMGHSERAGTNVFKNIPGNKDQQIFESGVSYFK